MAFTSVTVTGTATTPSAAVLPHAVVLFSPNEKMTNAAADGGAFEKIAGTDGTFSIVVNATDDSGTTTDTGNAALYDILIKDPNSGETVQRFRAPVPHATTPTTLTALLALGV